MFGELPRPRATETIPPPSATSVPDDSMELMTVAVWVKVYDGIALATDSAGTVSLANGSHQVYNNSDKIFHLHRNLPVGAMTWGLGQIGPASISTVSKSLRLRLMGRDNDHLDWALDENYTIEGVAERVAEMFCEHQKQTGAGAWGGQLGYIVAGYSAGSDQPEVWKLEFQGPCSNAPAPTQEQSTDQHGYKAYSQPDAVNRLFEGYDERLKGALEANINPAHHPLLHSILEDQKKAPVNVAMPFPDAIGLAKFLVETTAGYSHFLLGPDTVGGPVEVAGISLHEGFKWIARKHYFSTDLNRGELP